MLGATPDDAHDEMAPS